MQTSLRCNSCELFKGSDYYSKNQLRKKSKRRCKQCINCNKSTKYIRKHRNLENYSNAAYTATHSTNKSKQRHIASPPKHDTYCNLMCPQRESSLRLSNKQYHKIFERDLNHEYTKYSLIKEYSRSSAGQVINKRQIRSPAVLYLTLQYLLNITLNNTCTSYIARFSFIEDRLRAIIKDIVQSHERNSSDLSPKNNLNTKQIKCILSKWYRNVSEHNHRLPSNIMYNITSYTNSTYYKQECMIKLFEQSIRFRIFSNVLLCHLDQLVQQQKKSVSASTVYQSNFLKLDLNANISNKFVYSSVHNLQHVPFLLNHLFTLYSKRDFEILSKEEQNDEIQMYCIAAYYRLVIDHEQSLIHVPLYVRKHWRIKQSRALIEAYLNMNRALFFKLYHRLSIMEQVVLYPILDRFRVICIRKMCNKKCVRMPPWNLKYRFTSFVNDFGFYKNDTCTDSMHFLRWFGGFDENKMEQIVQYGLEMNDLCKIKWNHDATRFSARDSFLLEIDSRGFQRIIQSAGFIQIGVTEFYEIFKKIECLEQVTFDNYLFI